MLVTDIRCFKEYDDLPSFPEKDAVALADKMEKLLDQAQEVEASAAITRHNADKFGMDRIFGRHLEVYREALGQTVSDGS